MKRLVQHFEGFVEFGSITETTFDARLKNLTVPFLPESTITIEKSQVPSEGSHYIQEGFVFEWKIYKEKSNYISNIDFHKISEFSTV